MTHDTAAAPGATATSTPDATATANDDDEEEAEWEKFQSKMNRREKALEGKSKISHSVHSPYFTDDKQEFWWIYVIDRKQRQFVTLPSQVTSLADREEVKLQFNAPKKTGNHFRHCRIAILCAIFGCI